MKRLWNFIVVPQNLAALTAIGTLLGFLWSYFAPKPAPAPARDDKTSAQPASPGAQANARDNAAIFQNTTAGRDIDVKVGSAE